MKLLDLLCSVHEQQYVRVIVDNNNSTFDLSVDGTAAYVIRAYDIHFYMQDVKSIRPFLFQNKLALEIQCAYKQ